MAEITALIILILVGIQECTAVNHTLKYFCTASSGLPNFPSFVYVGFVNDVQISYCDSKGNRNIYEVEWIKNLSLKYPDFLKEETLTCRKKKQAFEVNLAIAKRHINQTKGVHIFQQMYGCEWDDETGKVKGYDQFGYDGEDLITLDLDKELWITAKPEIVINNNKWDHNKKAKDQKFYLTDICVDRLKIYVKHEGSPLNKTEFASISFLQKTQSSPVSCLATGFYPNRTKMFWRKDGKVINDGVKKGEILPNNDGTFQMSVYMDVSSVPLEDWPKYECVFRLSGVKRDTIKRLVKTEIKSNEQKNSVGLFVLVFIGVIIVIGVTGVIGVWLYKKYKANCQPSRVVNNQEAATFLQVTTPFKLSWCNIWLNNRKNYSNQKSDE